MIYFSYNDFSDCTENGKINKIIELNENIVKYEITNEIKKVHVNENNITKILKKKIELKMFLEKFLNFNEIKEKNNLKYCNIIKCISDKDKGNIVISKVNNKEIFILIKVIERKDINISYKMFEHSINIIKQWKNEYKGEKKRYPIVIPIIIEIMLKKKNS